MNKLLLVIIMILSLFTSVLTVKQVKPTLKEKAKALIVKTANKVKKAVQD